MKKKETSINLQRIYEVIEKANQDDKTSKIYDTTILVLCFLSLSSLLVKGNYILLEYFDAVALIVFIIDYILRLITAPFKYEGKKRPYLCYIKSPLAILDIVSILPSLTPMIPLFKSLRLFRLLKTLRLFKIVRYSKNLNMILRVFKKEESILLSILGIACGYIFFIAILMFNLEKDNFKTFFDALYWSVISLTTVGYGDIYPISNPGKLLSMFSSLIGIALIALPSAVITAGFLEEIKSEKETQK